MSTSASPVPVNAKTASNPIPIRSEIAAITNQQMTSFLNEVCGQFEWGKLSEHLFNVTKGKDHLFPEEIAKNIRTPMGTSVRATQDVHGGIGNQQTEIHATNVRKQETGEVRSVEVILVAPLLRDFLFNSGNEIGNISISLRESATNGNIIAKLEGSNFGWPVMEAFAKHCSAKIPSEIIADQSSGASRMVLKTDNDTALYLIYRQV